MQIDLLYFDDCPSWQDGLKNLKDALAVVELKAEIRMIRVDTDADATRLKFLGSPSFQIGSEDLWLENRTRMI